MAGAGDHRPRPLTFEPILKEKVWGGTRLSRYGKRLEAGRRYGESWELADLASTSAGGGGGGAAVSVVSGELWNGGLAGADIGELIAAWGEALLGPAGVASAERFGEQTGAGRAVFPLLLKLLDAREHLSVQVHPSPAYAEAHAAAHLKTESWVVLEAEQAALPGGEPVGPSVFRGFGRAVRGDEVRSAAGDGSIAALLRAVPSVVGECHTLPSGTCHALGAGTLVAEVQTPSDTTFRLYDWAAEYGRAPRALHLDESLACLGLDGGGELPADAGGPAALAAGASRGVLARTEFYRIEALRPAAGGAMPLLLAGGGRGAAGFVCLMVAAGSGRLVAAGSGGDAFEPVPLAAGATVLVPAACAAAAAVEGDGLSCLAVGPG